MSRMRWPSIAHWSTVLVTAVAAGTERLPAQTQRSVAPDSAGARICEWDGWLPPDVGRQRFRAAHALGARQEAAWREALLSPDAFRRDAAARALEGGRDTATVTALLRVANDANEIVRSGALRSLGRVGSPLALPTLIAASRDGNKHIRQAAVWSLGQLQSRSSVAALLEATRDTNEQVRSDAAWALGMTADPAALPRLVALSGNASTATRVAAVCAIGALRGAPPTSALSDSSTAVRAAGRWARARS